MDQASWPPAPTGDRNTDEVIAATILDCVTRKQLPSRDTLAAALSRETGLDKVASLKAVDVVLARLAGKTPAFKIHQLITWAGLGILAPILCIEFGSMIARSILADGLIGRTYAPAARLAMERQLSAVTQDANIIVIASAVVMVVVALFMVARLSERHSELKRQIAMRNSDARLGNS